MGWWCISISNRINLFDNSFIVKYVHHTSDYDVTLIENTINKLNKSGIVRYYKHSNKINFLEGTDIDIEQELADVSKEINHDFSDFFLIAWILRL